MRQRFLPSVAQPLRWGYAMALFLAAGFALRRLSHLLPAPLLPGELARSSHQVIPAVLSMGALLLATWLGCAVVPEPMAVAGLPLRRAGRLLGLGLAVGAGFISLVCAVPAWVGASTLAVSPASPASLVRVGLPYFVAIGAASASEELLLRGFLFRQLCRGLSPLAAVLLTGALFGAAHFRNPHTSTLAVAVIALVGIWFGLVRLRSGSIWAPIGMHAGWNWFEGFVWGHPVSGVELAPSLVHRTAFLDHGGWTGGAFGPEAAWLTAACLVLAIACTVAMRPSIAFLTDRPAR